jgi:hypothetical protein
MLDTEKYTFADGKTALSAAELNARFWALVRRLHALESLSVDWAAAVAQIQNHGLERINEAVLPLLDSLKSDLDALVAQGATDLAGYSAQVDGLIARGDAAVAETAAGAAAFMAQVNAALAGLQAVIATVCPLDEAGLVPEALLPLPALPDVAPSLVLPFDVLGFAPSGMAFSRASGATMFDVLGVRAVVATNVVRVTHDQESGQALGLLIEAAATRLNLYAAAPSTPENVNTSAQAYTVSWTGAGTVTLGGTAVGGVSQALLPSSPKGRSTHTFTALAGTLTVSFSGDVRDFQVEAGIVATSPIIGEGSQVARAADVATVPLSAIKWNTAEGAIFLRARTARGAPATGAYQIPFHIHNGGAQGFYAVRGASRTVACYLNNSGVYTGLANLATIEDNTDFRLALSWSASGCFASVNGGAVVSTGAVTVPQNLTTLHVGALSSGHPWNSTIAEMTYFPRALTAADVVTLTK